MVRRRSERRSRVTLSARTARRRAVVEDMLADYGEFVSAQELHSLAVARGVRVGLTTVYRTLHDMEIRGRTDVVLDASGTRQYRARPSAGHQHYLICRFCGTSRALDSAALEDWVRRVGADSEFAFLEHVVQLTGVCVLCQTAPNEAEPARRESAAESELDTDTGTGTGTGTGQVHSGTARQR
ncbi:Fur family transcriptional regulator [Streptomyces johnsoniae]|uniref:Transcriptional repressor n=1 Tax=Streptomyces johnsoniae TaxID=3075532 RepID=A0ABU2S215_9ACTN|nr:transcriptional repressor [Streptomyces sp. DSM 41886]MDT0443007.1 transcriptional repressor [Streptomyces sp. DSM 41886]